MVYDQFSDNSKKHYKTLLICEPPVRIELTTFRLQGGCSTTELGRRCLPAHYVSEEEIEEILRTKQL
jgi:hypothetical protein